MPCPVLSSAGRFEAFIIWKSQGFLLMTRGTHLSFDFTGSLTNYTMLNQKRNNAIFLKFHFDFIDRYEVVAIHDFPFHQPADNPCHASPEQPFPPFASMHHDSFRSCLVFVDVAGLPKTRLQLRFSAMCMQLEVPDNEPSIGVPSHLLGLFGYL
jgi:hypothetical protein